MRYSTRTLISAVSTACLVLSACSGATTDAERLTTGDDLCPVLDDAAIVDAVEGGEAVDELAVGNGPACSYFITDGTEVHAVFITLDDQRFDDAVAGFLRVFDTEVDPLVLGDEAVVARRRFPTVIVREGALVWQVQVARSTEGVADGDPATGAADAEGVARYLLDRFDG